MKPGFLSYLYFTCLLVWLIPPFRQYKTKYFYYFLVLASSDPVAFLLYSIFAVQPEHVHILIIAFLVFSLLELRTLKRFKYIFLAIPIVLIYASTQLEAQLIYGIIALLWAITLILFFEDFVLVVRDQEVINLFYVVVILYTLSVILKIVFARSHQGTGYLYFFLTNGFQLLIGIYFIFFNVNNSKKISIHKSVNA